MAMPLPLSKGLTIIERSFLIAFSATSSAVVRVGLFCALNILIGISFLFGGGVVNIV